MLVDEPHFQLKNEEKRTLFGTCRLPSVYPHTCSVPEHVLGTCTNYLRVYVIC